MNPRRTDEDYIEARNWRRENALQSLTDNLARYLRDDTPSGQTPEEILIAREQLQEDERRARRKLSREMFRTLVWMGTDSPEHVRKLIDWALPIEEAYMLRRYMLHRDVEREIGESVGITGQGVSYRLYRALWRLRQVQDLAWDLKAEDIRGSLDGLLPAGQVRAIVALWASRFSQSQAAEMLGDWPGSVKRNLSSAIVNLEAPAKTRKDVARIHRTLLELKRRKLWFVAPGQRVAAGSVRNSVRMPGAG